MNIQFWVSSNEGGSKFIQSKNYENCLKNTWIVHNLASRFQFGVLVVKNENDQIVWWFVKLQDIEIQTNHKNDFERLRNN